MPDEGLRDTGEAIVVSTTPDVCKTPPKMVPVPYTIVGRFNTVQGVTPSVRMAGDPSFTLRSRVTTVVGDEAGVGGGVVSGVNKSTCEPISSSPSVRATGSNLVRHNDQFRMNNGNTVGRAIFEKGGGPHGRIKADGTIADANPAPRPETPAEQKAASEGRGLWGKLKDWGTEAGHQVTGFGKGVYKAGEGMVTGIGDLAKGAYNASGQFGLNLDPAATQAAREGFSNAVNVIREDPGALLDAVVADYRDAIARGDYGEALGRGVVDIGSIFIPGAGAAGKVGKGAEAAGALGKVGEAAGVASKVGQAGEAAADLGKLGEAAGKLGQAGDTAADVGKLGQAAQDAAQVGDAASTAGRVRVTKVPAKKVIERDQLDWSIVKKKTGETRQQHVETHRVDNLNKDLHGVFDQDPVLTVQEAWDRGQHLGIPMDADGTLVVPMGRKIGWEGGRLGSGGELHSVTIHTTEGNKIITAYPSK